MRAVDEREETHQQRMLLVAADAIDERHRQQLQYPGERARLDAAHHHARDERNEHDDRRLIQHVDDVGGLPAGTPARIRSSRREQDADRVLAKQPLLVPCAAPLGSNPARRRLLRELAREPGVERRIGIARTVVGRDEERRRDTPSAHDPEEACLMNQGDWPYLRVCFRESSIGEPCAGRFSRTGSPD